MSGASSKEKPSSLYAKERRRSRLAIAAGATIRPQCASRFAFLPPAAARSTSRASARTASTWWRWSPSTPANDTKQRLRRFARQPGGQIATALAACARLGWRARYIGRFGDDDLGAQSRESLIDAGVDVSAAPSMAGTTNQFAIILVDARTGTRTILWDRHPGLTMEPADVPEEAVTSARVFMLDCHAPPAATHAARCARRANIPTLVDVDTPAPGILELLQQIDIIIAAESFPAAVTGHAEIGRALDALARESNALLVLRDAGRRRQPRAMRRSRDSDARFSGGLCRHDRRRRRLPGSIRGRLPASAGGRDRGRARVCERRGGPQLLRPGSARSAAATRGGRATPANPVTESRSAKARSRSERCELVTREKRSGEGL